MRKLIVVSLALVCVSGCGQAKSSTKADGAISDPLTAFKAAETALNSIQIDNSTPDRAIKSLWSRLEARRKVACLAGKIGLEAPGTIEGRVANAFRSQLPDEKLFVGEALAYFKSYAKELYNCDQIAHSFDYTINDVKTETDSRAVIAFTVRNILPIPEGAEIPADYQREAREKGIQYRFVFTKVENTWLLEQAYENDPIMERGFRSLYNQADPSYPYMTYDSLP